MCWFKTEKRAVMNNEIVVQRFLDLRQLFYCVIYKVFYGDVTINRRVHNN